MATTAELSEAQHECAIRVAREMRSLSSIEQRRAVHAWREVALDVREAALEALRRGRERRRQAKLRAGAVHNHDPIVDAVIAGVKRAAGRPELIEDDIEIVLCAVDEVRCEAMAEVADARERSGAAWADDSQLRRWAIAMPWIAALAGYAHRRGIDLAGSHAAAGLLGVGKANPVHRIAVLALAELGHRTADIALLLEMDPAYVRRLARSARVS